MRWSRKRTLQQYCYTIERLHNNDFLMYSTNNEGKSVITEMFIKTLPTNIYEKMTVNIPSLIFFL